MFKKLLCTLLAVLVLSLVAVIGSADSVATSPLPNYYVADDYLNSDTVRIDKAKELAVGQNTSVIGQIVAVFPDQTDADYSYIALQDTRDDEQIGIYARIDNQNMVGITEGDIVIVNGIIDSIGDMLFVNNVTNIYESADVSEIYLRPDLQYVTLKELLDNPQNYFSERVHINQIELGTQGDGFLEITQGNQSINIQNPPELPTLPDSRYSISISCFIFYNGEYVLVMDDDSGFFIDEDSDIDGPVYFISETLMSDGTKRIYHCDNMQDGDNATVIGQVTYTYKDPSNKDYSYVILHDWINGYTAGIAMHLPTEEANNLEVGWIIEARGTISVVDDVRYLTGVEHIETKDKDYSMLRADHISLSKLLERVDAPHINGFISEALILENVMLKKEHDGTVTANYAGESMRIYNFTELPKGIGFGDYVNLYCAVAKIDNEFVLMLSGTDCYLPAAIYETIIGDVDADGYINMVDVVCMQKYIAKLGDFSENIKICADVDRNGNIDMLDVTIMQKYIAKLLAHL